jgi:L-alanine-DL-glutamate epimerase-like enolase superfamily enzyme
MACWDIIGKETGRPVHDLLGGRVHDRLRTYTYLYPSDDLPDVYDDPQQAAAAASRYVEQGFTAVKLDPAGRYTVYDGRQPTLPELDQVEAFMAAIREAVGDRADICFGTHGQYTAAGALRVASRVERFEPLWFEEPVPPDNPEEMARVAAATRVPVATGERLTTKSEFRQVLAAGAAAILQPNLGRIGGILEAKKVAAMAEAHQVLVAPHLYSGPVLGAANIQLCACTPNFLVMEGIEQWGGFHAELITPAIVWEDGAVIPPTGPGLGIELNEAVARAHPWDGDELHIMMDEEPYGP